MIKIKCFELFLLVVLLASCKEEDIYYQTYTSFENNTWSSTDTKEFQVDIKDTTNPYHFYFNLRHTNAYKYRNMFVFWKLISPDGKTKTDTAQFILADRRGKWHGKSASGTIIDNSMWFLKAKLPTKGLYRINFVQGMRDNELECITDVGLKIVKNNDAN